MDYSLLVGFSRSEGNLIIGLVDYLRQYTWDKQVESWVKASGLLGGAGKEPTIISPNQYAQRFRQTVLSHLSSVPQRPSEAIHDTMISFSDRER